MRMRSIVSRRGLCRVATEKMAEHKLSQEVSELLQQRIPEARKQLRDSHKNLNDLATYCERNYIETGQSTQALEDTKKYAAQSLASVAYQVNMLATGMLELLDKQMQHLGEMEANISHISQVCVSLHSYVCVGLAVYVHVNDRALYCSVLSCAVGREANGVSYDAS